MDGIYVVRVRLRFGKQLRRTSIWLTKQSTAYLKWVFKTEEEQSMNGTLVPCQKSSLVACEDAQIEGVGYSKTYAPAAKLLSLDTVIAVVSKYSLLFEQLNIFTAFLNGHLNEEVYVEQQKGFEEGDF